MRKLLPLLLIVPLFLWGCSSESEVDESELKAEPGPLAEVDDPEEVEPELEFPEGILLSELPMEELHMKYRLAAINNGWASTYLEVHGGDTSGLGARNVKIRTYVNENLIVARLPIDSLPAIVALPNVDLYMPEGMVQQ